MKDTKISECSQRLSLLPLQEYASIWSVSWKFFINILSKDNFNEIVNDDCKERNKKKVTICVVQSRTSYVQNLTWKMIKWQKITYMQTSFSAEWEYEMGERSVGKIKNLMTDSDERLLCQTFYDAIEHENWESRCKDLLQTKKKDIKIKWWVQESTLEAERGERLRYDMGEVGDEGDVLSKTKEGSTTLLFFDQEKINKMKRGTKDLTQWVEEDLTSHNWVLRTTRISRRRRLNFLILFDFILFLRYFHFLWDWFVVMSCSGLKIFNSRCDRLRFCSCWSNLSFLFGSRLQVLTLF